MSMVEDDQPVAAAARAFPLPTSVTEPEHLLTAPEPLADVGRRYIWLMVLAQFGVFVAFITPLAISLSIRLSQLAPGREEYLGYITGAGAGVVVLTAPFLDRKS